MSAGEVGAGQIGSYAASMRAYRLAVAARVLLAIVGGYAVAALASALLALILPGPRAEAVSAATIASFAMMAATIIWVFAARTVGRATFVLALVATLLIAVLWLARIVQAGGAAA